MKFEEALAEMRDGETVEEPLTRTVLRIDDVMEPVLVQEIGERQIPSPRVPGAAILSELWRVKK